MRLLIDECLSTGLVELLNSAGHDTTHVNDQALAGQPDERVLAADVSNARVLVSADTDFGKSSPARTGQHPA
jgi:predicted nuclease of predicted toxin-antitoxin system